MCLELNSSLSDSQRALYWLVSTIKQLVKISGKLLSQSPGGSVTGYCADVAAIGYVPDQKSWNVYFADRRAQLAGQVDALAAGV